jgi:1-acyl-sn-glycerol-3-phosphate acyltransferase
VEGPRPTKFLAKSTLFVFPIKGFIEFCGALPVARPEDFKGKSAEHRSIQNRSTFKAAIAAMEKGWPVAVFPEGMSLEKPGLILPLKPGAAKLAFAAEEANDFKLGCRIIPVGLEYGSRSKVGSGLTIRYGEPIPLKEYEKLYNEDSNSAVEQVMERLTNEMIRNFPHFKDETKLACAKKLVALGLARSKHPVAQLFLEKENDARFWKGLEEHLTAFEESTKGRRIPVPAWGHRRKWKDMSAGQRFIRAVLILATLPLALLDLVNSSLPELCVQSVIEQIAVDDTEPMTLRLLMSPVVLSVLYGLQFLFLKYVVFENSMAGSGVREYLIYALGSFVLWYFGVQWRRQFKRLFSLFFFWRAGVDGRSEAVGHYRSLRKYLGDFQDHGR